MTTIIRSMIVTLLLTAAIPQNKANKEPPVEWIDPATGHRIVRLSREPGSASLYFHQNPYTAAGDQMVITTPGGISSINLKTRKIEQVVEGRASHIVVGRKTRQVFYLKDGTAYATNLGTRETRAIVKKPELSTGSGFAVNADETLLAGSFIEGGTEKYKVEREHWSVHYNAAPNDRLFAGDGGGPHSVVAPGNGQWIYLFTPQSSELKVEKLVNLAGHDYSLEPNVTFTPDMKWIVFRSNMHGATHVYAVEVAAQSAR